MSTEAGFLAEIREQPDEDAPRLVFADWLEDNGDPDRAEFIRTQVRLAAMPEWDPERFELEERERDLLAEHRAAWLAHLPKWVRQEEITFHRGLPEGASLSASAYARQGDRLAKLVPLLRLRLEGLTREAEVASLAATAGLTELHCVGLTNDRASLVRFFERLPAGRLRRMIFSGRCQTRGLPQVLADWPGLSGLTGLGVGGLAFAERFQPLLGSRHLGRLEWLDLARTCINADFCAWLTRLKPLSGLRRLDLSDNDLRAEAAHALGESEWALEELRVSSATWQADDLRRMLAARWVAGLRSLDLSRPYATDTARVLAGSAAGRLAHLGLRTSVLPDEGITALARSNLAAGLVSLSLSGQNCADAGFGALANSPRLARLRRLDLSGNYLTAATLRVLLESPHLGAVTQMDLMFNQLRAEGAELLARTPAAARLRVLGLGCCALGEAGAAALARSTTLRVVRLDLWGNALGDSCLGSLVQAPWLGGVRELSLGANGLCDLGATLLADCAALSRLRVLNLGQNPLITERGAAALADSPHLGRLLRLSMTDRLGRAARDRLRERFGPAVEFSN